MKARMPSPAMIVALAALVMATTGSAIAAVTYATNAGAVDGKSAVSAGSLLKNARGKLVATARGGENAGRIPGKFVADVTYGERFGRKLDVPDNAAGGAIDLTGTEGLGKLTATCADQSGVPGREDPRTVITFTNGTRGFLNLVRSVGEGPPLIAPLAGGTVDRFAVDGSTTFRYYLEQSGTNVLINGVVRQDARNTPGASCLVYGTVQVVR